MCMVLLCFVMRIYRFMGWIYPYSSRLPPWPWDRDIMVPMPVNLPEGYRQNHSKASHNKVQQKYFSNAFLEWKFFIQILLKFSPKLIQSQVISLSGISLMLNKQQPFTQANLDPIYWHIYANVSPSHQHDETFDMEYMICIITMKNWSMKSNQNQTQ